MVFAPKVGIQGMLTSYMYVIKFSNSYIVAVCLCSKFLRLTGNFPLSWFEQPLEGTIINKLVAANLTTSHLNLGNKLPLNSSGQPLPATTLERGRTILHTFLTEYHDTRALLAHFTLLAFHRQ